MNQDFLAKTETLKEKIDTLSKGYKNREAEDEVVKFIKYLRDNNHDGKKLIDDLIVSSYMYLKIINPDAPCLEKLKDNHKNNRNINCNSNRELKDSLGFNCDSRDLSSMPPYSFIIEFKFTLEKPYISKDDENFTIIENSIKREKVLGCPYIPGSTWKGCLRSALWQDGKKENDKQITRVFGNERSEKNTFNQGRLHFFPSFFGKSNFEVINPHDRQTRAGTNPILIECIPAEETGKFSLLYVPFDNVGNESVKIKKQMLEDLKLIVEGLKLMFTVYGFGAKTSSGYGLAKINKGLISVNAQESKKQVEKSLPKSFKLHEAQNGFKETIKDLVGKEEDKNSFIEKNFTNLESLKESVGKIVEVII